MPFETRSETAAVVAVLALAIGLALAMLVANQAVGAKVQELNASVGTVLTVNPAGGQGFEGGGEPLTSQQAVAAAGVPNVAAVVVGTRALRLRNATEAAAQATAGTLAGPGGGPGGQSATALTTSLTAAVDAGTLGNRIQDTSGTTGTTGTTQPAGTLPITATGTGAEVDSTGKALALTEGTGLGDYTAESTQALLGTTLAEKNNLKGGSTFTINSKTFTVPGVFQAGTAFGNNALYIMLPTAQTLAELPGELSTMIVTIDSMENVDAAKFHM